MNYKGSRAGGAFGLLNRPHPEIGENLRKAFLKAKECVLQQSEPTTRKFPLSAIRRRFSHILALDVIFSPRLTKVTKCSQRPDSRLPMFETWEPSPVWRAAPKCALKKAEKLSSLLHVIATDGWKANISHLLVRLATVVWQMSYKDFSGLCRTILSRIYRATKLSSQEQSPDPVLRFSALSTNPVANNYCVSRFENRSRANARKYGVNRLPRDLWLRANLLHTLRYKARVRQIGLRQPT